MTAVRPPGKPRPSCLACSVMKRRCEWPADDVGADSCIRCTSVGRLCQQQDWQVPRRVRDKQGKPEFYRQKGRHTAWALSQRELLVKEAGTGDSSEQEPSLLLLAPSPFPHPITSLNMVPVIAPAESLVPVVPASPDLINSLQCSEQSQLLTPGQQLVMPSPTIPPTMPFLPEPDISSALLIQFVEAYWTYHHYTMPMLHLETFQKSFANNEEETPNNENGKIYNGRPPNALLCAVGAIGSRIADIPNISAEDRGFFGAVLFNRAKRLLAAAGYLPDSSPLLPGLAAGLDINMTDLEALQTMILVHSYGLGEGGAMNDLGLLKSAAEVLNRLAQKHLWSPDPPSDVNEWLTRDMVARAWWIIASLDETMDKHQAQAHHLDYLGPPAVLPMHERYFGNASSETAFNALKAADGLMQVTVDLSPALDWVNTSPDDALKVGKDLIRLIGLRRSSGLFSLLCLQLTMVELLSRLKSFAASQKLDIAELASQLPSLDNPAEAEYRKGLTLVDGLASKVYSSMPDEFGPALSDGAPQKFFDHAERYFSHANYALSCLCVCVAIEGLRITFWTKASAADTTVDQKFMSSPWLLSALECSIRAARMFEAILHRDPTLRYTHIIAVLPATKVGFLDMAAVNKMRDDEPSAQKEAIIQGLEEDVRIVLRYLQGMGRIYPNLGKQIVTGFKMLMAQNGIREADEVGLPVWAPPIAANTAFSFGSSIVLADTWLKIWLSSGN